MQYLVASNKGPQAVEIIGKTFMSVGAGEHAGWRLDAFVWICGHEIRASELITGFNLARIPMASVDGSDIDKLVDGLTDKQYEALCTKMVEAASFAAFHRFKDADDAYIAKTKALIASRPVLNCPENEKPAVTH